ncbi:MAG TPA: NADP oxidoreductase, partial [Sedimenticola sp.]|nr:NADP oxidoreductase [Sedimenticola sp.]
RDLLLDDSDHPGEALQRLLAEGPEAQLQKLEAANLRGRGGAGFRTALKWHLCREARDSERYVVCNADEGEPGTFKDRVLLQHCPDQVIEGMTLCAGVIGARRGFLYLRGEYRYLLDSLEQVLERRRKAGLLGEGILGRAGFDFDIEIHLGAGAYVCGEESALIESLEGKRGIPRNRPPFPVTEGYLGHPTVVNNVETLMAATRIVVRGSDWFRAVGTEESTGTKLLSISGDCARPGVYEYPMGVSIRGILADCGGSDAQTVQLAGAAGETIPAWEFDRCMACEDAATGGSFMVIGEDRELPEMVQNFSRFFAHESCGFCTPCRVGGTLLRDLVEKLVAGHATEYDLGEMRHIGRLMRDASHCGLGHTAPNPVMDLLEKFPERCRALLSREGFEPAFDLEGALSEARALAGRGEGE